MVLFAANEGGGSFLDYRCVARGEFGRQITEIIQKSLLDMPLGQVFRTTRETLLRVGYLFLPNLP